MYSPLNIGKCVSTSKRVFFSIEHAFIFGGNILKKFLKFLWCIPLVLIVAFAFTGCFGNRGNNENDDDNDGIPHEHRYDISYDYDDTAHWLNPLCDDTTETKGYEEHTLKEIITKEPTCGSVGYAYYDCTKCKYRLTGVELPMLEHKYSQEWLPLEDSHVHRCTSCRSDIDATNHNYVNGKCKDCGYSDGNRNLLYTSTFTTEAAWVTINGIKDTTEQTVVIPSHIGGVPVTTIGNEAFKNNKNIISVTLSDSVTSIGIESFSGCSNLTTVVLGNGIKAIGRSAFKYCENVQSINFPEGLTTIGSEAFVSCKGLQEIELPSTLKEIRDDAFWNCTSLTKLTLPDGIETIGIDAFANCGDSIYNEYSGAYYLGSKTNSHLLLIKQVNNEIESVKIHEDCKIIYYNAMKDCANLNNIVIPSAVKSIYIGAFTKCPALKSLNVSADNAYFCSENNIIYTKDKSVLVLGASGLNSVVVSEGVREIREYAFASSSLMYLGLPDSLKIIGNNAFARSALTVVEFNDGLEEIGEYAFYYCESLVQITIPTSVTKIGYYSFRGCDYLTEVRYQGSKEQWNAINKVDATWAPNIKYTVKCTDGDIVYNEDK